MKALVKNTEFPSTPRFSWLVIYISPKNLIHEGMIYHNTRGAVCNNRTQRCGSKNKW